MPVTLPTLPDTEGRVIAHLYADSDVQAITTNVGPRNAAPYPCLAVNRVGGTGDLLTALDTALIQLDAWGEPGDDSTETAVDLKNLLAVAEMSLRWRLKGTTGAGVIVTAVRVLTRAQRQPDPATRQQRYFTRLLVSARTA